MRKATFIFAGVALIFITNIFAQDPPRNKDKAGAQDFAGISRYEGAFIQEYNTFNYTDFYMGLGEAVRKDFDGHGTFFSKYLSLKGKLYNAQYLIPSEEGIMKVYENYKDALTKANYTILYTERNKNSCFWGDDYFGGDQPFAKQTRDYYGIGGCDQDYYYIVAKGVKDSLDIYVSLFISIGSNYGKSFVGVNQAVVETVPLELGLVKVDNISQNIDVTGHSIFYDIHFATGSAQIDTKSDNQLEEIGAYLKANPDKKYYVVGHTDNVGDFESNKILSENRAKAVMTELTTKYDVDVNQLKPFGIANLSPVVSNTTEQGKARNRRVEIVEK